jgi:hypothetical protein
MKRILTIVLVFVLLGGCSRLTEVGEFLDGTGSLIHDLIVRPEYDLEDLPVSKSTSPQLMFNKIIVALDNKDSDALYTLFAPNAIKKFTNLDNQISALMQFYKGEWVSNNSFDSGSSTGENKNGRWIFLDIEPIVRNLKTDEKTYTLQFNSIPANDNNPEDIGLWLLRLGNEDGDWCVVGDAWLNVYDY